MGYSRDVYLAAEDEMQRRRMDALRKADERSARFYENTRVLSSWNACFCRRA